MCQNMQKSDQYHVVQLPELSNSLTLKNMLKERKYQTGQPLFQIYTRKGGVPLIASNAQSFLKTCIAFMRLNPSHYTFHSFCKI